MVSLPELTRRVFLKRSFQAAGALVSLPWIAPACAPVEVADGLRVLSAGDFRVLTAVADSVVPRGGAFATGAADVDVARRIDALLAPADPRLLRGLRAGLALVEYAGGLLAGRPGRFSRLSAGDREAVLAALPHRFGLAREAYAGLRALCLFAFYSADESWPALGYEGPWVSGSAA